MSSDAPVYSFEVRSAGGFAVIGETLVQWRLSPSCLMRSGRHRFCRLPDCVCECHAERAQRRTKG